MKGVSFSLNHSLEEGVTHKMFRKILLKVIEYGQRYQLEYLGAFKEKIKFLQDDWYQALQFFFDHSFYQGRRDELSDRFRRQAVEALDKYLRGNPSEKIKNLWILHEKGWFDNYERMKDADNPLQKILQEKGVSKSGDRLMVIDTLRFILTLKDWNYNVVQWAVYLIKKGKTQQAYDMIDDVWSLGDKTTSFFLRDLVSIFNLEKKVGKQDQVCQQPIDTWVRQVAEAIGIVRPLAPNREIKQSIIEACLSMGISPITFNQGAWYIGTHALDIAIESLGVKLKVRAISKKKPKSDLDPDKDPILSLIGTAAVEPFSHKIDQELYGGD